MESLSLVLPSGLVKKCEHHCFEFLEEIYYTFLIEYGSALPDYPIALLVCNRLAQNVRKKAD